MSSSAKKASEYLRLGYMRVLVPESDGNAYSAQILEFPGCFSYGDTPEEAYKNLEEVAECWIEAAIEEGQQIPEPFNTANYSGRIALRLPKSLHQRAAINAEKEGVSLNQFLMAAIAEKLGEYVGYEKGKRKEKQTVPVVYSLKHSEMATVSDLPECEEVAEFYIADAENESYSKMGMN